MTPSVTFNTEFWSAVPEKVFNYKQHKSKNVVCPHSGREKKKNQNKIDSEKSNSY